MPDPYTQLLEWRRAETSARGLAKLPKEFYEANQRYLSDTRAIFEAELRENPSSRKGELARQTYTRAQQLARDIIEARIRKLLDLAFQAAVGGTREVPNALPEERTLFDLAVGTLRNYRRSVAPYLEPVGSPGPLMAAEVPLPASRPLAVEPVAPPEAPRAPGVAVYVRILQDGRSIALGKETIDIRKEDVLSVPEETAKILVGSGLAQRIRTGEFRPVT
ncbi:MAG: DNA replication complex GINS family protein [Thermoplasmata archaeon]|nr:DNA replication complex GINS family protein [Thermoplasmata archaeon]